MKLFGSSNKGKRAASGKRIDSTSAGAASEPARNNVTKNNGKAPKKKMSRAKSAVIIISAVIVTVVLLFVAAVVIDRTGKPEFLYNILFSQLTEGNLGSLRTPASQADPNDPDNVIGTNNPRNPGDPSLPIDEIRDINTITFLILGIDGYRGLRSEGGANTDVVMIASFDRNEGKMEIASLPRDTIVNVPWSVKKVNSIYAHMLSRNSSETDRNKRLELAMEETREYFADLLGFYVDFWITIDMNGFEALVNSLPGGGVRFNVRHSVHLEDPDIGMNITLNPGEQTLNGMQALALVRDRDLPNGDFGRIESQQAFLKATFEQILARRDTFDVLKYAGIFLEHGNTNMDLTTMGSLGLDLLKLSGEDINFTAVPGTTTSVGDGSYVYIHLDEWLEIVNTKLSPFKEEIKATDVSVYTRGENGRLYVTDDNYRGSRSWGN